MAVIERAVARAELGCGAHGFDQIRASALDRWLEL
jgi:hypothetical protein